MSENDVACVVVNADLTIHKTLSPRLFESVYGRILEYELVKRGLHVDRQVAGPVLYDGLTFDEGFRANLR